MRKSYSAFNAEYHRYVVLRFLSECPDGRANDDITQTSLVDAGYEISHDDVLEAFRWLADQRLVLLRELDPFLLATLTRRGGDVVAGRTPLAGVRKPLSGIIGVIAPLSGDNE